MLRLLLYLTALSQLTGAIPTSSQTCTVTGPAVIDFATNVGFVRTRCAYTLMSAPGLQLIATFRERRRTDVTFLDEMILRLDSPAVDVHLEQDGEVRVGDTALNLTSSPATQHGVELSKDVSGVKAKVSLSTYTTTVLFDGTTAQIHVTGSASLQGLCENSNSSLSSLKITEFSSDSCETEHTEPLGSDIKCSEMTDRCDLLKAAPFTSCPINSTAYVTACSDTLCRYPAVDGLRCQFLQAYAAACGLQSSDVGAWRSNTGCSPPAGFCQNTSCSDHEFCGEDVSGQAVCLCRAHFASKYRPTGAFGDPTVCEGKSASVSLARCLLAERGIDYSQLHLNKQSCAGQMDEETHMVTFSFNDSDPCGTVVLAENNKIKYKNSIKTTNSSASDPIFRHSFVNVDFSCDYGQPNQKFMTFTIKGGKALQQIESGTWKYNVSMSMCADIACTTPINFSDGIGADQVIYMSLDTEGLDPNIITLKSDNCMATNTEQGDDLVYPLIQNGCGNPDDSTVRVVDNGKGGTMLVFQMFQFRGSNSGIFLKCKMKLCLKSDPGCQKNCNKSRRRREVRPQYEDQNPVIVSMSWT